jgi:DNA polymerase-3 subunit delta
MLGAMTEAALRPVYLLLGSDRPKVARALARLRRRFHPASVETLADGASGAEAVAACNALGLFAAGGRLVLVEGVEGWRREDVQAVASYLESPAPATVLCLVAGELRPGSPLVKLCERAGQVLVYDVPRRQLARWVAEQFSRLGGRATEEACRLLVQLVGERPEELALEVEKLVLSAQGQEVDSEMVEEQVAARDEATPWALTDAWGRRDVGGVLAAWERLRRWGGREGEPSAVAWRLAEHLALVRACRRLAAEGVPPAEAARRLGRRSEYPVRKAYEQGEAFAEEELEAALLRLADLDLALKGKSRLPGELELERALVETTRRRAPGPPRDGG